MNRSRLASICATVSSTIPLAVAHAEEATPPAAQATVAHRSFGDTASAYTLSLGLASAAPALFKDTPDMTLSETTVFAYGGQVAVMFGDEFIDAHRLGLRISYGSVARSLERSLTLITPMATYQTGHPLQLEVGLGWAIPRGTAGFADNYGGLSSAATLRWSFRRASAPAKVGVGLGVTGQVIAATSDFDYSSAYVGAHVDIRFHLGAQGGVK